MNLNIKIGPYEITQRTMYSKLKVIDTEKNKDISDYDPKFEDDIINDYLKQNSPQRSIFEIKDNKIYGFNSRIPEEEIKAIKYLFIPEGITSIAQEAFKNGRFELISFPSSLKTIESFSFLNCKNLKYVDLPDSIITIGTNVFEYCINLETAKLPNITGISKKMFYNCHALKNIHIPNTVVIIDSYAFANCNSLKDVKLPKSVDWVDAHVFESCENLKSISLPGATWIGPSCFNLCKSLENVSLCKTKNPVNLGDLVFTNCTALKEINFPSSVDSILEKTFLNCENLEKVNLPNSIEYLCCDIFSNAPKLENIVIPSKLRLIDNAPFGNSNLKSLTFEYDLKRLEMVNGITGFGQYDLLTKSKIDKLIISKNVETIVEHAFSCNGKQIKEIDYLGTKEEFEKFKENNKKLFKRFSNLKKVNFKEEITLDKTSTKEIR